MPCSTLGPPLLPLFDQEAFESPPYSFSSPVNLNVKRARPPATIRPTQLTHFGTAQSPMMADPSVSDGRTTLVCVVRPNLDHTTSTIVVRQRPDPHSAGLSSLATD